MDIPPEWLMGGGALSMPALIYLSTKAAINGLEGRISQRIDTVKEDVGEIKDDLRDIHQRITGNTERIATMEGRQNAKAD